MICSLVSVYFEDTQLGYNKKQNVRYARFWFFRKGYGNSFSTTFCEWFFKKKHFSYYILLTDQISVSHYLYLLKYWTMRVFGIVCFPGCNVLNFEINLSNQAWPKVKTKSSIPWERKVLLKWNKKHFSLFLKGF